MFKKKGTVSPLCANKAISTKSSFEATNNSGPKLGSCGTFDILHPNMPKRQIQLTVMFLKLCITFLVLKPLK